MDAWSTATSLQKFRLAVSYLVSTELAVSPTASSDWPGFCSSGLQQFTWDSCLTASTVLHLHEHMLKMMVCTDLAASSRASTDWTGLCSSGMSTSWHYRLLWECNSTWHTMLWAICCIGATACMHACVNTEQICVH